MWGRAAGDGERRTSAQRRTASDGERDEHGVAGAMMVVNRATHRPGDSARAAQSCEPRSAVQLEERSPAHPRRNNNPERPVLPNGVPS